MWQIHKVNKTHKGFTLLEMLIAIAIFAMLGLAANAVLQGVIKNDTVTKDFSQKLRGLQQGIGVIGRDLNQMVARTARQDDGSRTEQYFISGDGVLSSASQGLSFFRVGWLNPEGMLPRGSIQAVAYVQQEDRLERWFFPYPDPDTHAEPNKTVLMTGVESVAYSFFINDAWQKNVTGKDLPHAVAIEIVLKGTGKIQRKFLLPELATVETPENNNDENNDNKDQGDPQGDTT